MGSRDQRDGFRGTLKGQYAMPIKTKQMVRIPVNTFSLKCSRLEFYL